MTEATFKKWMERAIALAKRCSPSTSAFSVGALVIDTAGNIIGEGYSRERGEQTHAEQNAITAARELGFSTVGATIVSTMEPCSIRSSGKRPCCDAIAEAGIRRVLFAQHEPATFVRCDGERTLHDAGIEVIELPEFAGEVSSLNAHLSTQNRETNK